MPDIELATAKSAGDNSSASSASASIAAQPVDPVASKFDAIVDLWFAECIQNSDVARHTPAYNAALAAKEDLKARLAKEI